MTYHYLRFIVHWQLLWSCLILKLRAERKSSILQLLLLLLLNHNVVGSAREQEGITGEGFGKTVKVVQWLHLIAI
jgi:hypothetical protein